MTSISDPPFRAERIRRTGIEPGVRDIRIVHELDGLRSVVHPDDLDRAGHDLWALAARDLGDTAPTLILGLDAGGILPAVAVSRSSGIGFRLAWKLDLDLDDKHKFEELHARRTEVFVYGQLAHEKVVIVDDEVTTGETVIGLCKVLTDAGAVVLGVAALVEDRSGNARERLTDSGIPLWTLTTI